MSAPVIQMRTAAESALIERFAAEKTSLPGAATERAEAFARFEAAGLPGRRVESYHYTDLRNLMRTLAPVAGESAAIGALDFEGLGDRLVLVNGRLVDGKAPAGVEVEALPAALMAGRTRLNAAMGEAADTIVDLNAALCRDGLFIRVTGAAEGAALHLAFNEVIDAAASVMPRIIVAVEAGVSFTLVESHIGPAGIAYQKNTVVELVVGDGAKVEHIRVNEAGDKALMLSTLAATLGAEAELKSLNFTLGGEVSRHQSFITYVGENAKLSLNGATMLKGRQHCDNTLVVDHAVPLGTSRELFRTVVDGSAQGVFQGKIIVRPHAQKTDGQMASNALLLSDDAGMSNKPELEIFADDVVCAHGATCGALDDNQLFYLMARGLPRAEAEALLVEAFIDEVLDHVGHDGLRAALTARVSAWMQTRGVHSEP
jgi:Fe-S cluster assembly protein SufD